MKREEKTRLTRERIISAGIKEFGTKGYSGASINSVSDSGIAKGLLYHNFTKYELYKRAITFMINESRKQNNRSLKQVINDQVVMKVRYLS